jgi:putative membrane protein
MNFSNFSILFFAIGGALIFGLEKLKVSLEEKNKEIAEK